MNCNKKMCVAGIAAFGTHAGSTQRRELGSGQFPGFGNGVAHGQHQPISGRMEHETDLVGERRTAAGAVGGELRLMPLDQILGLAAGAEADQRGRASSRELRERSAVGRSGELGSGIQTEIAS